MEKEKEKKKEGKKEEEEGGREGGKIWIKTNQNIKTKLIYDQ